MRYIIDLIEAIRKEIPKSFVDHDRMMRALDDVIDSSKYRAPEAYIVNFEQLAMYLENILGKPNNKWKQRIADIFADKIKVPGMRYLNENI